MRALLVRPQQPGSVALEEVADPSPRRDEMLVEGLAVGVCGTDKEIIGGHYGWAPPGRQNLVLGHESLGRVLGAPADSGFTAGDLVAGVVRRPDPVPCGACAAGEFDMCRNGRYTERGIKQIDGYGAQQWCVESGYAVKLDPVLGRVGVLIEPTSVVAKAWEQIERVGNRSWFRPERALITGAGAIGLLAALLAAQRGLEVHVLDRITHGPKPELVRELGGTYHTRHVTEVLKAVRPDIVIEATGAPDVVFDVICGTPAYGIACMTGVSSGGRRMTVDAGMLNRELVLDNDAVFGSVNANLRHYQQAARALAEADMAWLERLITRRVPLDHWQEAFTGTPDDVKVVIALSPQAE